MCVWLGQDRDGSLFLHARAHSSLQPHALAHPTHSLYPHTPVPSPHATPTLPYSEKGAGKRLWSMPEERDRATREGYDYWYWATHRKVFMEFSRVEHDDVARLVPGGPWPEHWAKESGMRAALERRKEREAGEGSGVAMGKATEEESGMAMGAGGEGESQVTGEPREKRVLRMLDLFR